MQSRHAVREKQAVTSRQPNNIRGSGPNGKDRQRKAGRDRYSQKEAGRRGNTDRSNDEGRNKQASKALETDKSNHSCMEARNITEAKVGR